MHFRSALTPYLLASVALPAFAVDQEIDGPRLHAESSAVSELPPGPIAVARFSSSHDGDWLAVVDGRLLIGVQNARFAHVVKGPTGQEAVLALPRPDAATDLVLGVGAGGLVRWTFDPTTANASATVLNAGWSSVTALAADAHGVVYGWSPASSQVRRFDTTSGNSLQSVTVTSGILDLVAIDWDDDGTDEFAVRTASAIQVVARTGQTLWSTTASPVDRIACVRGKGSDRDLLARTTYVSGAVSLATWNDDQLDGPELVMQGGVVGALLAADVVGVEDGKPDGDADLLMASLDGKVWVLQRSIHPDYRLFPDLWEPGRAYYALPSNAGAIALGAGDLDQDGDVDTLFGVPALGRVEFQLDMRIRRGDFLPGGSITAEIDGNALDVTLSSGSTGLATGATHLLVEVWAMDASGDKVAGGTIASGTIPLGSTATHAFAFASTPPLQSNGHPLLAVSYRAVRLDENGATQQVWAATGTYVTSADLSTLESLPEVQQGANEHAFGVIGGQQVPRGSGPGSDGKPPPIE